MEKDTTPLRSDSLDHPLSIPVFMIGDAVEVTPVSYQVIAVVVHHGPTPASGHYTTLLRTNDRRGWRVRNDERVSWLLNLGEYELSNAYLIFLNKSSSSMQASGA